MADYEKMYLLLAAKTEQALELLESDGDWRQKALHAEVLLITGMQECEEIYVQTTEYEKEPPRAVLFCLYLPLETSAFLLPALVVYCYL